jgi:hypothetical protein
MKAKLSKGVREYMATLGRKGGKVTGVKGFNSETAKKAAIARWGERKSVKLNDIQQ